MKDSLKKLPLLWLFCPEQLTITPCQLLYSKDTMDCNNSHQATHYNLSVYALHTRHCRQPRQGRGVEYGRDKAEWIGFIDLSKTGVSISVYIYLKINLIFFHSHFGI